MEVDTSQDSHVTIEVTGKQEKKAKMMHVAMS